jgi:hypothetical protein
MKRLMVLAMALGVAAPALAAETAPASTLPDRMAAFTHDCNDLGIDGAALETKAKAAKLTARTKAELARAAPIQVPTDAEPMKLKSDLVKGWWLDGAKSASLTYQEAKAADGKSWRSCVLSARAPDASVMLKAMLAVEAKPNPEAWTNREGQLVVITFDKGAVKDATPGSLMAQVEKSVPFPDMNFQVFKKDPQWAPHTPHPISVTEAELFAATAQPGTVAFKRESPVAK